MKTVLLIALLLAGIVPAGGFAQTPNGRAGTLDLRASPGSYYIVVTVGSYSTSLGYSVY